MGWDDKQKYEDIDQSDMETPKLRFPAWENAEGKKVAATEQPDETLPSTLTLLRGMMELKRLGRASQWRISRFKNCLQA